MCGQSEAEDTTAGEREGMHLRGACKPASAHLPGLTVMALHFLLLTAGDCDVNVIGKADFGRNQNRGRSEHWTE